MKIICTNRNEKDFQSMIFDTNLSWEELKYFTIKRIAFDGHIINKTMYGIGSTYPDASIQQVLVDDDRHFSIKYKQFNNEPIKDYWAIQEFYRV